MEIYTDSSDPIGRLPPIKTGLSTTPSRKRRALTPVDRNSALPSKQGSVKQKSQQSGILKKSSVVQKKSRTEGSTVTKSKRVVFSAKSVATNANKSNDEVKKSSSVVVVAEKQSVRSISSRPENERDNTSSSISAVKRRPLSLSSATKRSALASSILLDRSIGSSSLSGPALRLRVMSNRDADDVDENLSSNRRNAIHNSTSDAIDVNTTPANKLTSQLLSSTRGKLLSSPPVRLPTNMMKRCDHNDTSSDGKSQSRKDFPSKLVSEKPVPTLMLSNFQESLWIDFGSDKENVVGNESSRHFLLSAPEKPSSQLTRNGYRVVIERVPVRKGFSVCEVGEECDHADDGTCNGESQTVQVGLGESKKMKVVWTPTQSGAVREVILLKLPRGRLQITVQGSARVISATSSASKKMKSKKRVSSRAKYYVWFISSSTVLTLLTSFFCW